MTRGESIHIAIDSDSDFSEDSDPPLPKSRRAAVKSLECMHSKRDGKSIRYTPAFSKSLLGLVQLASC
jgi:hypothetical protein